MCIRDRADIVQILVKKGQMACFDQRCFFGTFYNIRIIAGPIFGFHHHVENSHGGVENSYCVDVFGNTSGRQWKYLLYVYHCRLAGPRKNAAGFGLRPSDTAAEPKTGGI